MGKNTTQISKAALGVLQIAEAAGYKPAGQEEKSRTIRYCIDQGVNYINLGHPYYFADPAGAAAYVKAALEDGYREKVQTALNIPAALISSTEEMDQCLAAQLSWFGLEYTDVILINGVYRGTWHKLKELGLADWLDKVIGSGQAKTAGYVFHDEPFYLTPIDEYYDWSVMQADYSFMDERHHPGNGGLILARRDGLKVIVSNCTKGGRLTDRVPEAVQAVWDAAEAKRSPEEWAIRYVYNNPSVDSVQFDPETVEEAKRLLAIAEQSEKDVMTLSELLTVREAVKAYESKLFFGCPACRCCMPCPIGVDAPRIGELYNDICMYGDEKIPLFYYRLEGNGTPACVNCGRCVTICPKKNPLPEAFVRMKELSEKTA